MRSEVETFFDKSFSMPEQIVITRGKIGLGGPIEYLKQLVKKYEYNPRVSMGDVIKSEAGFLKSSPN